MTHEEIAAHLAALRLPIEYDAANGDASDREGAPYSLAEWSSVVAVVNVAPALLRECDAAVARAEAAEKERDAAVETSIDRLTTARIERGRAEALVREIAALNRELAAEREAHEATKQRVLGLLGVALAWQALTIHHHRRRVFPYVFAVIYATALFICIVMAAA